MDSNEVGGSQDSIEVPQWNWGGCKVEAHQNGEIVSGSLRETPTHLVAFDEGGRRLEEANIEVLGAEGVKERISVALRAEEGAL